jgi:OOP family OmpA-OmpF porin
MRLRSYLPVAIALILAGLMSLGGAWLAADRIEAGARAEVGLALVRGGHDWAEVEADGLQVILTGTAPDEASRFNALTLAGSVVDAARVIDAMAILQADTLAPPRFGIEILRNDDGVSVFGLVPASTDRADLVARIVRASDGARVTDLVQTADFPEPQGWAATVDFALDAMEDVGRAKLSIAADSVAISAITESEADQRRLESALRADAPDGIVLTLDVRAPRPAITPFALRFVLGDGRARFDACSAATEEGRDRIVAAAVAAGFAEQAPCRIGLGAPSPAWPDAAVAAIQTLDRLGSGRVSLTDADVVLVARETVAQTDFDRETEGLQNALPDGFSLTAILETAEAPAPETPESGTVEFVATRSPEGLIQLRGRLRDDLAMAAVESFAHARFGIAGTRSSLRRLETVPPGWGLRVLAALEGLSLLNSGVVRVTPETVTLTGATGNADVPSIVAGLYADKLGDGGDFSVDVTYEERLDPMAGLPTAEECVARINAVTAVRKITFDPGSSDIEAAALGTVDEVAEILRECQPVEMQVEIAGHTDSQGRESMNLRLSQARADAVLNAIMSRRVLVANIRARGYGEAEPIADNQTEEGREANRRIEFRLIREDAEAVTAEDGASDEERQDGQN